VSSAARDEPVGGAAAAGPEAPAEPVAARSLVAAREPLREERRLLILWYCSLLGVIAPVLVLGFIYSALANRLIFVGWGLAVAAVYTVVLRQGFALGWRRPLHAGVLGLLLAGGFAWLAGIERTHHEILDLGFRAVFPGFYHPLATRPASAAAVAALLAAAGAGALIVGSVRSRETA
jgi:hypothetical protein